MILFYGKDAEALVQTRADSLRQAGDMAKSERWHRIAEQIRILNRGKKSFTRAV